MLTQGFGIQDLGSEKWVNYVGRARNIRCHTLTEGHLHAVSGDGRRTRALMALLAVVCPRQKDSRRLSVPGSLARKTNTSFRERLLRTPVLFPSAVLCTQCAHWLCRVNPQHHKSMSTSTNRKRSSFDRVIVKADCVSMPLPS